MQHETYVSLNVTKNVELDPISRTVLCCGLWDVGVRGHMFCRYGSPSLLRTLTHLC